MKLRVIIVACAVVGCGKGSKSHEAAANYPAYANAEASGSLEGKDVTFARGYVVGGKGSVNGQTYTLGTIRFFVDPGTPVCPAARIPVPNPSLGFFLPLRAGEHVYENDPYIYRTMPSYWGEGISPITDKRARATTARMTIDSWDKDHIVGKVYAKGELFEINGTFDLKNCDGVLPEN